MAHTIAETLTTRDRLRHSSLERAGRHPTLNGLDEDSDGIACEELLTATDSETATDEQDTGEENAVEETAAEETVEETVSGGGTEEEKTRRERRE